MLMIDLENNFYSASSLYAVILQIFVMMLDRFFYIKVDIESVMNKRDICLAKSFST